MNQKNKAKPICRLTQSGQSLIEYLIIVALVAVAAIGMVKVVGYNISAHFANIGKALGGDTNDLAPIQVKSSDVSTHDLGTYMKGAAAGTNK